MTYIASTTDNQNFHVKASSWTSLLNADPYSIAEVKRNRFVANEFHCGVFQFIHFKFLFSDQPLSDMKVITIGHHEVEKPPGIAFFVVMQQHFAREAKVSTGADA